VTKEKAKLDEWCKTVSRSTELRKWYRHDPERFTEFARRYRDELTEPEKAEALRGPMPTTWIFIWENE
jgi:uncharacterized protein YeaO (DUF488 family)